MHPANTRYLLLAVFLAGGLLDSRAAIAARLRVVVATAGQPLADAIVALHPLSGSAPAAPPVEPLQMRQRGLRFEPHVLAIQRGASVDFPNLDRTRHHLYSFSEARRFELKLYLGKPAAPVRFDTAGIVTLGCNIHDWMLGYVVVLDTDRFGQTGASGELSFDDLPAGRYRLWLWHARVAQPLEQELELDAAADLARRIALDLGPAPDLEPPAGLGLPEPVRLP